MESDQYFARFQIRFGRSPPSEENRIMRDFITVPVSLRRNQVSVRYATVPIPLWIYTYIQKA
jgi:hypothetical protein